MTAHPMLRVLVPVPANLGYGADVRLAQSMAQNEITVLVMTPAEFLSVLQDRAKQNPAIDPTIRAALANTSFGKYWKTELGPNVNQAAVLPLGQMGADLANLGKTINALGVMGAEVYAKGSYLIFKGPPALRNVLTGTRYLKTNPQIVQLGLGIKGAGHVAKGGFVLGLVVSSGVEITDFIFNDEKTMYDLVGGIGVEAVKAGLGALIGYGAGAIAGAFVGLAVAPLGAMLAFAFIAGWGLNELDNTYDIKKKVAAALKAAPDGLTNGYYQVKESGLIILNAMAGRVAAGTNDSATLQRWDALINETFRQLMRRY